MPLIVAGPGVSPGKITSPAMVTDIAPTLVDSFVFDAFQSDGPMQRAVPPLPEMEHGQSTLPDAAPEGDFDWGPDAPWMVDQFEFSTDDAHWAVYAPTNDRNVSADSMGRCVTSV
ncbi:MAG: hypothetical protein AAFQ84_01645 [Pseudomonadota bacterium]